MPKSKSKPAPIGRPRSQAAVSHAAIMHAVYGLLKEKPARDLTMALPVVPPIEPMLAKLVSELPLSAGLLYEPKWDGFRSVVFRDGDEVELSSRSSRPLTGLTSRDRATLCALAPTLQSTRRRRGEREAAAAIIHQD